MSANPSPDPDERSPVHFDLTEANLEQYDAVLRHLRRGGHYHELTGTMLTVQARHADDVRALLANPSGNVALTIPAYMPVRAAWTNWSGQSVNRRTAPRWARLAGAVVDVVAVGLVLLLAAEAGRPGEVIGAVAASLLLVAMTGLMGVTLGKFIVRTRVEGPDGGAPGIPRALVRWAVTALPSAIAAVLFPVSEGTGVAVYVLGNLVVYVGVLAHPEGRGLHDMAAGTTVVRHR